MSEGIEKLVDLGLIELCDELPHKLPEGIDIIESYRVKYVDVHIVLTPPTLTYYMVFPYVEAHERDAIRRALVESFRPGAPSFKELVSRLPLPREVVEWAIDEVDGLGILEVFLQDPYVEDVHLIGNAPIRVVHSKYGAMRTNIVLPENYVSKLISRALEKSGVRITMLRPFKSFSDPRGYRITVMMKSDISYEASSLVVRRPLKHFHLGDMIRLGTLNEEMAAILWLCLQHKLGILIIGEMGSGKTSMATAILSTIPPSSIAVVIEDTPELVLPIPAMRRIIREAVGGSAEAIEPFELIRHAVREAADYVIVGEVRGPEAAAWAQAMLLGHGGLTTFHADAPDQALWRLTLPPLNVASVALDAIYIIVHMRRLKLGLHMRRVASIYVHEGGGKVVPLYTFDTSTFTFEKHVDLKDTRVGQILSYRLGWSSSDIEEDIATRVRILNEVKEKTLSLREFNHEIYLSYYRYTGSLVV